MNPRLDPETDAELRQAVQRFTEAVSQLGLDDEIQLVSEPGSAAGAAVLQIGQASVLHWLAWLVEQAPSPLADRDWPNLWEHFE
ncbi:hypothetical protein SAMN05443287_105259 [Micromonospora phaseoli]|uniref:Uncharacterized protein n=1 Tax=Micromonospora phaseoli TaxID=1144548 RepID=A0A1H6ZRS2_9ACTN|nr:hypothetical protein [Micromonospora phaseoli]PZV97045.1 hypothetical protein CLV64_106153 [Micromonospora phaseoli]GIJ77376.1 hypothetical protein Xph01_18080 [Micromonospora phaseoli]SEJ56223.1 hypothetical protein SAMN05443287_105259 [Micromonospora phaseoli]